MESREFGELVGNLRGSAISCLMLMLGVHAPMSIETLEHYSGYCLATVVQAMKKLLYFGLIERCDDENSAAYMWQPTQQVLDMMRIQSPQDAVPEASGSEPERQTADPPGSEVSGMPGSSGYKNIFPVSSSSSLYNPERTMTNKLQRPTTTTTPRNVPKTRREPVATLADDANLQQAIQWLLDTGIGDAEVVDAIKGAIELGWVADQICDAVEGWLKYAASDAGATIKHPGFFTAKRIKTGLAPPKNEVRKDPMSPDRYISGKFGHLIKH